MIRRSLSFALLLIAACGGGSSQAPPPSPPAGETHETPAATEVPAATSPPPVLPPTQTEPVPGVTPIPPAEVTTSIELKNGAPDSDLVFSTTKGWQPVVFAYTGKPGKAKSVMLFSSACLASCDSGEAAACPSCPEPKNKKEELAMARSETAPAGGSVKVPWDGKVFVFGTSAGKQKCKCWRRVDPPPDSYTIKACGLRPSKEPGKPSKPVCAETKVALGSGETPHAITINFGK
jgi:hypothetical protein